MKTSGIPVAVGVALTTASILSSCMQVGPTRKPDTLGQVVTPSDPAARPSKVAVPPVASRTLVPPASLEAGQKIARQGAGNGVAACSSCHGAQGEGNPASGFPRIAGQSTYYLSRQMVAFTNGSRSSPIMTPIAKALDEQQIRDVSAYFASAAPPAVAASSAGSARPSAAVRKRGEILASVGDQSQRLQACANCHGPGGVGEAPTFPYLAGQHANYLKFAMAEWKNGNRKTDSSAHMPLIAKTLNDQDIAAVAAFYSAQPAPPPAGRNMNVPAGSAARPVVGAKSGAAGPQSARDDAPARGAGVGSGTSTNGGSQGPGGGGAASSNHASGNR